MGFIYRVLDLFRQVVGLVLPVFGRARDLGRLGPTLRTVLHCVLLVLILSLLVWLNLKSYVLQVWMGSSISFLQNYWVPLLFLLVYGLSWLGWVLWKLLLPEEAESEFPDIDEAWDEAVDALNRAGIELTAVPLFLILGKPAGGEDALFQASTLPLTVRAPKHANAPLHVYANAEAVYVTCPGASLLGKQAAILQEQGGPAPAPAPAEAEEPGNSGALLDANATASPEEMAQVMQGILLQAEREGRNVQQLTEKEKADLRVVNALGAVEAAQPQARPRRKLLQHYKNQAYELSERLRHLCHLLVRDRRPYCPLNGMFVALPFSATDTQEDATETGAILQQDLAVAREVLQLNWPTLVLVCDMEQAPGFREFCDRLPSPVKLQRIGHKFPLVLDDPAEVPAYLASLAEHVYRIALPNFIWPLFRVENSADRMPDLVRANGQLFRLLEQLRERSKRLANILSKGIGMTTDGVLPLLGGCYVGATGRDPGHEQAFIRDVFRRLLDDQALVSWTEAALREEGDYQRWTRYGYTAVGIVAAAVLAGIGLLVREKMKR